MHITKTAFDGSDAPDTASLDIDAFNLGSDFGFAVQDPQSGTVILRANVPEMGGISLEHYLYIIELFDSSFKDLVDMLSEEE